MFNYLKRGVLIGIKDNKLAVFLPFSKHNYINDYYEELYFDRQDRENLLRLKSNPKDLKLIKRLYFFYNRSKKNRCSSYRINDFR